MKLKETKCPENTTSESMYLGRGVYAGSHQPCANMLNTRNVMWIVVAVWAMIQEFVANHEYSVELDEEFISLKHLSATLQIV